MGARLRGRQILTLYPLMAEKSGHLFAALLHRAGSPHVFGEGDREREEDLRVTLWGEFFPLISVSQQHLPPLAAASLMSHPDLWNQEFWGVVWQPCFNSPAR